MKLLILLSILVVLIVLAKILDDSKKKDAKKRELRRFKKQRDDYLESHGVDINNVVSFEYQQNIVKQNKNLAVVIDEKREKIYFFENSICKAVSFKDIIGYEIKIDNESVDSAGSILAGSLLAGSLVGETAGAIMGAASANGKISSCSVYIYTSNISNPYIEILLFKDFVTNRQYMSASYGPKEYLDRISATLKAILYKNKNGNES